MCQYKSFIVDRYGKIYWCEEDSHEEIIRRAKLRDNHVRNFVRVEVLPPFDAVTVDQDDLTLWESIKDSIDFQLIEIARRIDVFVQQYEAVKQPAREQYEAVKQSAWEQYEAVEQPAREQCIANLHTIEGYVS